MHTRNYCLHRKQGSKGRGLKGARIAGRRAHSECAWTCLGNSLSRSRRLERQMLSRARRCLARDFKLPGNLGARQWSGSLRRRQGKPFALGLLSAEVTRNPGNGGDGVVDANLREGRCSGLGGKQVRRARRFSTRLSPLPDADRSASLSLSLPLFFLFLSLSCSLLSPDPSREAMLLGAPP
jgi:hypothetical protein